MADYSGEAFGGKGREPEENLRIFLGCKKARPGTQAYDFSKGSAKFEYKHSRLHLTRRHGTKAPLNRWQFSNLRGQGGNKSYDYLILEGDAERGGDSYLFVISFQEVSASFPGANVFVVTLPRVGGRGLRRGGRSEFVGSTESAESNSRLGSTNMQTLREGQAAHWEMGFRRSLGSLQVKERRSGDRDLEECGQAKAKGPHSCRFLGREDLPLRRLDAPSITSGSCQNSSSTISTALSKPYLRVNKEENDCDTRGGSLAV